MPVHSDDVLQHTLSKPIATTMGPIAYTSSKFSLYKEEFEDTKGVIKIRKSKKNRQHNGQKEKVRKDKHTHKTKDRVT